ncbi:beta-1,6-N-acetylglucosaminyltransferase [Bacillus nitratireducens]|uniref:beta-1,6-N-acetylglucosaminyltransferase n=1 Tax=Bacillus nitratireducens TaxID=2026193 RepID=UPI003D303341
MNKDMRENSKILLEYDKSFRSKPRIAYILQVHKNPEQVNQFISQLISEKNGDVFVHIDKKNFDAVYPLISKNENLKILNKSVDVKWGDISQVEATILLLKTVLETECKYDFVCFRSGQDLVVKNGFVEHLLKNSNKIFMTATHVDRNNPDAAFPNIRWPKVTRKQYSIFHPFRFFRRLIMILYGFGINIFSNPYKLPDKMEFYHGSQWFCIPLDVAKYIIEFLEQNSWYYYLFKHALCPDEWFFQTIIMNSDFKCQVINNNLVYLKWGEDYTNKNHPIVFTLKDVDSIESSNQYFARKFDRSVDEDVIGYFANRYKT